MPTECKRFLGRSSRQWANVIVTIADYQHPNKITDSGLWNGSCVRYLVINKPRSKAKTVREKRVEALLGVLSTPEDE
ncbi:hypothetical protein KIN20_014684 [Parelaphostrongylus tenuis]|uniref:Uncharacterized protein n=1 Tax=Parelaphostrongylus tenuis TaxID=148309 RepID=A0AAD5MDZ4_PARTN|nr:hypothetical protein KIN20_014684 [Parelaphostrongylus tenuis]